MRHLAESAGAALVPRLVDPNADAARFLEVDVEIEGATEVLNDHQVIPEARSSASAPSCSHSPARNRRQVKRRESTRREVVRLKDPDNHRLQCVFPYLPVSVMGCP